MKTKRIVVGLGLLGATICIGLLVFFSASFPSSESSPKVFQTQATNGVPNVSISSSSSLKRQIPGGPYEPSDPRWAKRQHRRELDPLADWKTPFSFYGKVIDQFGGPIQGAKVHFTWNDYSESGSAEADTLTDVDGLFSLKHKKGKRLLVSITKDGYYSAESNPANQFGFEFAEFSDAHFRDPDSVDPVIFRIQKIGKTEALYYREQRYIPPVSNPQIDVSLQPGEKPDFRLDFKWGNRDSNGNFDWSVSIQGLNGTGLVESTNPQVFIAPTEGYQHQLKLSMSTSDPHWSSQIQKQYFVQLGGGLYARIDGEFGLSNSRVPSFYLTWVLNPSGSRNLEFDPSKQINP